MAAMDTEFLQAEVTDRKLRLQAAVELAPHDETLKSLLREVDSALDQLCAALGLQPAA